MKKYSFTDETMTLDNETILHRIKAERIFGDAQVYENARAFGDARVSEETEVTK